MSAISEVDIEAELGTQIAAVAATGGALEIVGSGSKQFYGESVEGVAVDVSAHSGVIDYDPAELVITLRAGSSLAGVEALLAEHQQMFGFEPPHFGPEATVGGMVASGLAGPRRAYAGSIRDFVLGVKMLDGRGEVLRFGGRVIKNVAGFDLARLMVGSMGTLGVILEVSIRVIPRFDTELTLAFEHESVNDHVKWINQLGGQPLPISASAWYNGRSLLRLSGSEQGVAHAHGLIGGEPTGSIWDELKEQRSEFFDTERPITRISLPPSSGDLFERETQLIEWGGAQRWVRGDFDIAGLRQRVAANGGSVCAYRGHAPGVGMFQPLPPAMLKLQRSIKSSFDPAGIFNRGKLYTDL